MYPYLCTARYPTTVVTLGSTHIVYLKYHTYPPPTPNPCRPASLPHNRAHPLDYPTNHLLNCTRTKSQTELYINSSMRPLHLKHCFWKSSVKM